MHMHRSQGQTLEMNRCSSWKRTSCKPACIQALLQQRRLLACRRSADPSRDLLMRRLLTSPSPSTSMARMLTVWDLCAIGTG